MIETCKNYCVLKAFDIDSDMVSKCKKIADSEGVSLEFKQRNLDCKITLVNKSTSDIVFQRILDEILEVLDGNVYANYDTTLEQCVIEIKRQRRQNRSRGVFDGRNDLFKTCQRVGIERRAIRRLCHLRRRL